MTRRRDLTIKIYTTGWHGDAEIISRHRSMTAARRAFTWTLNNGFEHLGLRRGQIVQLVNDGVVQNTGTVR